MAAAVAMPAQAVINAIFPASNMLFNFAYSAGGLPTADGNHDEELSGNARSTRFLLIFYLTQTLTWIFQFRVVDQARTRFYSRNYTD